MIRLQQRELIKIDSIGNNGSLMNMQDEIKGQANVTFVPVQELKIDLIYMVLVLKTTPSTIPFHETTIKAVLLALSNRDELTIRMVANLPLLNIRPHINLPCERGPRLSMKVPVGIRNLISPKISQKFRSNALIDSPHQH